MLHSGHHLRMSSCTVTCSKCKLKVGGENVSQVSEMRLPPSFATHCRPEVTNRERESERVSERHSWRLLDFIVSFEVCSQGVFLDA